MWKYENVMEKRSKETSGYISLLRRNFFQNLRDSIRIGIYITKVLENDIIFTIKIVDSSTLRLHYPASEASHNVDSDTKIMITNKYAISFTTSKERNKLLLLDDFDKCARRELYF